MPRYSHLKRIDRELNGRRTKPKRDEPPAPYAPSPSAVILLRDIWAKREHLTEWERGFVQDLLRTLMRRSLSEKQTAVAVRIGKSLGIGYDDPALDAAPKFAPQPQPWGWLPLRPPGK